MKYMKFPNIKIRVPGFEGSRGQSCCALGIVFEVFLLPADQKSPDVRRAKFRGMRRTFQYAAMTRDERNAAGGRLSSAGFEKAFFFAVYAAAVLLAVKALALGH